MKGGVRGGYAGMRREVGEAKQYERKNKSNCLSCQRGKQGKERLQS